MQETAKATSPAVVVSVQATAGDDARAHAESLPERPPQHLFSFFLHRDASARKKSKTPSRLHGDAVQRDEVIPRGATLVGRESAPLKPL